MPTAAKIGHGSVLTWNSIAVPEILTVSLNGANINMIDATSMDSANQYTEFIAGIRDGGEISVQANYTGAAGQTNLKTDLDGGTRRSGATLALGNPPVSTITFAGYVTQWGVSGDANGKLLLNVTIKIDGKPTIA